MPYLYSFLSTIFHETHLKLLSKFIWEFKYIFIIEFQMNCGIQKIYTIQQSSNAIFPTQVCLVMYMWYVNILSCIKDKCFHYKSILWLIKGSTIIHTMLLYISVFCVPILFHLSFLNLPALRKLNIMFRKWFICKHYTKIFYHIICFYKTKNTCKTSLGGNFKCFLSIVIVHWLLYPCSLFWYYSCSLRKMTERG